MNIFQRKIGIWYQTRQWAEYVYRTICEESADDIDFDRGQTMCSRNELRIVFKNGDTVRFVPLVEHSRGQKFTESYIQSDLVFTDKHMDTIMCVVRPCTIYGEVYLADEYEDLAYNRRRSFGRLFH